MKQNNPINKAFFHKETELTIGGMTRRDVLTCNPDTSLQQALRRMHDAYCSSIVVVQEQIPVGIWTESDTLHLDLSNKDILQRPIRDFMSAPVKTAHCKTLLNDISLRFQRERIRHLVIVDDQQHITGIVTQSDVVWNQGPEGFLYLKEIRSALFTPLLLLQGDMTLQQAIGQLRRSGNDAAVVQHSQSGEYGILTERDVVRLIAEQELHLRLDQLAKFPLISLPGSQHLVAAKEKLLQLQIRHLGVTGDDGHLIGLLSFADLLRSIQYEYVQQLRHALRDWDLALNRANRNLVLAHSVIESSLEGIVVTDAQQRIEMINPAFTTVTGYGIDEVIGRKPSLLSSGRHDAGFYREMWRQINQTGSWQGEIWNQRKSGEIYPQWLSINTIFGEGHEVFGYAAIFSDITKRKETEEYIRNLAYYDPLTSLPNRRLFMDRLHLAMANAKRHQHQLGVMFLDLDLFKRINDTLGHSAGDAILREAAQRLQGCTREGDTLARLGGDEFVLLLPELEDEQEITIVARRIQQKFNQPFEILGQQFDITTSIGISLYPKDGVEAETLLQNADSAMYRAKGLGRNGIERFSPTTQQRPEQQQNLESDLQQALQRQELLLAYQVKIDLQREEISGIEALLRWNHPQRGLLMPADFIPQAEQNGQIFAIGEWVLREACRQNKEWQAMGLPPTPVSVNLSAQQFYREECPEQVEQILRDTDLSPRLLELEIPESAIMQHADQALITLRRFRALGVGLAMDDFGTGFSSLSYLKEMPIDRFKIDGSLLHELGHNTKNQAIVASILDLGRHLAIPVVAEGVEDAQQMEYLRSQGCQQVQGYLIARPVSADNIAQLYQERLLPPAATGLRI